MNRADTLAWIEDLLGHESLLSKPAATPADRTCSAISPTCGDRVELGLHLRPDGTVQLRGSVQGCMLSSAAAAVGAEAIEGLDPASARALLTTAIARRFESDETPDRAETDLDRLATLTLVPLRRRCVAFSWQQMVTLLDTGPDSPADVEIVPTGR